jgi:4-diphosphocytidyl-2-C-methyl-D-erythritol kinase
MDRLELTANAKINLHLAVKYKRPDGFHQLESIFQEVAFGDRIVLNKSSEVKFTTDSEVLTVEGNNLCERAARLLQQEAGIPGLEIYLEKRIPMGAGLGGGSSDAAAVLRGANELYQLGIGREKLSQLGAQLGSDVPFFINGRTAWVTGRGEQIEPVEWEVPYWLILVFPGVMIPTALAYKNLNLGLTKKVDAVKFAVSNFQRLPLAEYRNWFRNDFEISVYDQHAELSEIRDELYQAGALYAVMSGSGSTIFGVFESESSARRAAGKLPTDYRQKIVRPVFS